mgnify:FL=1|jgi:hypothetical protein
MTSKNGYLGHVATLKDGRSGRILEGVGTPSSPTHQILIKSLDGSTIRCYHNEIRYVWNP